MLVVGGASGMARWLVEHVFGHDGRMSITLADVDPRVAGVVEELNTEAHVDHALISYEGGDVIGIDDLETYDCVLLGVPIPAVAETVHALFPHLRQGTLVFDICSTKAAPLRIMNEAAARHHLSVVGTHPPKSSSSASDTYQQTARADKQPQNRPRP
jgi:prephenate dehydrogenase